MGCPLSKYTNSRDNNFNLIRFFAAILVLYSHSFALAIGTGDAEPMRNIIGMTWGIIAVDIFFITSGFLITSSFLSRNNLIVFSWARILRIYPALIVAVFFCVFIVGLCFTTMNIWDYLSNIQTYKFLLKNSVLFGGVEYNLPGVFNDIPWKNAVNGSLWTLPYEVKMYVILAVILSFIALLEKWLRFVSHKNTLLLLSGGAIIIHFFNHFHPILSVNFVRLFFMFFIGATFYVWRDKVLLSQSHFIIMLLILVSSLINKELFFIIYSFVLPYLIFYIAYVPSGYLRNFNKIGDYSYGIYIYAFPVQQSMATIIPNISVAEMFLASLSITLFLSFISWHVIEKRLLKNKGLLQNIWISRRSIWIR